MFIEEDESQSNLSYAKNIHFLNGIIMMIQESITNESYYTFKLLIQIPQPADNDDDNNNLRLRPQLNLLDAVTTGLAAILGAGIFSVIASAAGIAGPALLVFFKSKDPNCRTCHLLSLGLAIIFSSLFLLFLH